MYTYCIDTGHNIIMQHRQITNYIGCNEMRCENNFVRSIFIYTYYIFNGFSGIKCYRQLTIVFSWRHLYYGKIAHIFLITKMVTVQYRPVEMLSLMLILSNN